MYITCNSEMITTEVREVSASTKKGGAIKIPNKSNDDSQQIIKNLNPLWSYITCITEICTTEASSKSAFS